MLHKKNCQQRHLQMKHKKRCYLSKSRPTTYPIESNSRNTQYVISSALQQQQVESIQCYIAATAGLVQSVAATRWHQCSKLKQILFSEGSAKNSHPNEDERRSFSSVHRDAFCQFPFRWIYYCHSSKSTGKETGKMHLCALANSNGLHTLLKVKS